MRLLNAIAATVIASILLSASASRADEPAAPQPLPVPASPQPPPGDVPPHPSDMPPVQVARPAPPSVPPAVVEPRVLAWNEGEPIPPGYYKRTERRTGLMIGGGAAFGAAWVPSAVLGGLGWRLGLAELAIPVVGPIMLAVTRINGGGSASLVEVCLVFDGIQQAVGIAMFVYGVAVPKTVLLRADVKAAKTRFLPVPMSFGKGSAGLGIVGTM